MSSTGSGSGSAGGTAARPPTSFKVLAELRLNHLPNNGKFVVQRQCGGSVPDGATQFYLAWSWDAPNGGTSWKGGGSVQADQIPAMIDALVKAYESETGEKLPACGGSGNGGNDAPTEPKIGESGTFADMFAGEGGD